VVLLSKKSPIPIQIPNLSSSTRRKTSNETHSITTQKNTRQRPTGNSTTNMSNKSAIKTDEKKQHFDDIYIELTPVPYKERILDALTYISDEFNRKMFDRLILPWIVAEQTKDPTKIIRHVDLCGCFGNTTIIRPWPPSHDVCRNL
jgi:hypothetical protein